MQGSMKPFNESRRSGHITLSDGSKDVDARSGDIQQDDGHKALPEGEKGDFQVGGGSSETQVKKLRSVE